MQGKHIPHKLSFLYDNINEFTPSSEKKNPTGTFTKLLKAFNHFQRPDPSK